MSIATASEYWSGKTLLLFPGRTPMDIILIIAILLLIFGGVGTAIGFMADVLWILIVIAVIIIAWRLIAGRRV
jgi:hypothetical protein